MEHLNQSITTSSDLKTEEIKTTNEINDGEPEVKPLNTLKELIKWKGVGSAAETLLTVPDLQPHSRKRSLYGGGDHSYKTLICHDYQNGYTDDRFCNGSSNKDVYKFYRWYGLDIFIYFSHHFVTIPPCGWVAAAHLHGVQMLGTLITEWDEGTLMWEEILSSTAMIKTTIDQLVAVTKAYRFDGWLVNIENILSKELIPKLIDFVDQFTKEIHLLNPSYTVLWYDAITIDGDLIWQNVLNAKNKPFFDVSDGIFLNYSWNKAALQNSVKLAGERINDVYVGIDVYRRNRSEGGYNSDEALKLIREANLSAAIFAFSWNAAMFGEENDFYTCNLLWNSFKPYLLYRGFKGLPFKSSFCQGFGKNYYSNGVIGVEGSWYNLMKQQTQPLLEDFEGTVISTRTETAFNGGSTFSFWTSVSQDFRLLLCEFPFKKLKVVQLTYQLEGRFDKVVVSFGLLNSNVCNLICKSAEPNEEEISESHKEYLTLRVNENVNGWKTSAFHFKSPSSTDIVTSIHIKVVGTGVVYIGEISIT